VAALLAGVLDDAVEKRRLGDLTWWRATPFTVALREIGRADAVPRLARLVADTGNFVQASRIDPEWARQYRYGREPKGTSSPAWSWDDLG
jgi:hypothetical protein